MALPWEAHFQRWKYPTNSCGMPDLGPIYSRADISGRLGSAGPTATYPDYRYPAMYQTWWGRSNLFKVIDYS